MRHHIGAVAPGILVALAFGLMLLGRPGTAQAALTIVQTTGLSFGVCEKVTGMIVVVQPVSGSQSNGCGAQSAGVLSITGGTANQSVTLTLPTSRNITSAGFTRITVNTFVFRTSAGQLFNTRRGTFNLDATGKMTVYVGATAQAQPASSGVNYAGTATASVL